MEVNLQVDENVKRITQENCRFLTVIVKEESLVLDQVCEVVGDWKADLQRVSLDKELIVLYKVSSESLVCIHYIPSFTTVRSKMMYSLAKRLLVKQFQIEHTLVLEHGDVLNPSLIESLMKKERVFTEKELEKQEVIKEQVSMAVGASTTHQSCSLSFPLESALEKSLAQLKKGDTVVIDIQNQVFTLVEILHCSFSDLTARLPTGRPLFFVHHTEIDGTFGYISPPSTPIKDRMLYAASKNPLISYVESVLGTTFKRIEIDSLDELKTDSQNDEKPVQNSFKRPARPGRPAK